MNALTRRASLLAWRAKRCLWLLAVAVLAIGAPPATAQKPRILQAAVQITIEARPLPGFEARDLSRRQFGALQFRGGLVLRSPHRDFGGISSIRLEPDGQHLLAVTD